MDATEAEAGSQAGRTAFAVACSMIGARRVEFVSLCHDEMTLFSEWSSESWNDREGQVRAFREERPGCLCSFREKGKVLELSWATR